MDYIARIPLLCGGAPAIPNRRTTVYDVVSYIRLDGGYQHYAHEFDIPLNVIKAAIKNKSKHVLRRLHSA